MFCLDSLTFFFYRNSGLPNPGLHRGRSVWGGGGLRLRCPTNNPPGRYFFGLIPSNRANEITTVQGPQVFVSVSLLIKKKVEKHEGPGLPGGSTIYQGLLFAKKDTSDKDLSGFP